MRIYPPVIVDEKSQIPVQAINMQDGEPVPAPRSTLTMQPPPVRCNGTMRELRADPVRMAGNGG